MHMASSIAVLSLALAIASAQVTGNHPEWPRWCGKVYKAGYPSFEPDGEVTAPPDTDAMNLNVQFKTRYNFYLEDETEASFVVNAGHSPWYGSPWTNLTSDGLDTLWFHIQLPNSTNSIQGRIEVGKSGVEFLFNPSLLEPRTTPYDLQLLGRLGSSDGLKFANLTYKATSSVLVLPRDSGGSMTKVDNLRGGLVFKQRGVWEPIFPYGYYGEYNGSNSSEVSDAFVKDYTSNGTGLNAIISLSSFPDTNPVYDSMDKLGLLFMYDLRDSFMDLSVVEQHVQAIKNHSQLFGYWMADEWAAADASEPRPDGWQYAFDAQVKAYDLIHRLDPYHPIAVTLNCENYYFDKYSQGADIIMEDVYPIGISLTFSSKWNTTCNTTMGDCGCDNCQGNVQDVSSRLDKMSTYEGWLGRWPLPKFHNPQVFHGDGYWSRDPTAGEARVMNALALNRGVTGLFGWTWPSSHELFQVHTEMARVVTKAPVKDILLLGERNMIATTDGTLDSDAACWMQDTMVLVSIVNSGQKDKNDYSIRISDKCVTLPRHLIFDSVVFGGLPWEYSDKDLVLNVPTLPAMSSSLVLFIHTMPET